VRTPASVSCTWSLSVPKRSSARRDASCTWREIHQNASAMKGKGSNAMAARRASTPAALEERGRLQRQARVQPLAQLDAETVRRGVQLQPPADAQGIDREAGQQQPAQLFQQCVTRQPP